MKSIAYSKTEAKAEAGEACGSPDHMPMYPYGTSLYLDDDTLAKLGITDLPKVGSTVMLAAMVKVTGTSQRASMDKDGKEEMRTCVDLQITDMEIEGPPKDLAKSLYSK